MELVRFDHRPFEALRATFRWRIPAVYNIGVDVCDKWASDPGRLALLDVTVGEAIPYTFDAWWNDEETWRGEPLGECAAGPGRWAGGSSGDRAAAATRGAPGPYRRL